MMVKFEGKNHAGRNTGSTPAQSDSTRFFSGFTPAKNSNEPK